MKKQIIFVIIIMLSCSDLIGLSQNKPTPPSVMIIPSTQLMQRLGYTNTIIIDGKDVIIPDYENALIKDSELKQVITQIGELFSDRGFPLHQLESSLSSLKEEQAEDMAYTSKKGVGIAKNSLDEIMNRVKPDIKLELSYDIVNAGGPYKALKFSIEAKDAYTNKQIASVNDISENTIEIVMSRLLKERVLSNIGNLQSRLMSYFDDVKSNGREIFVRVNVFEDAGFDLEKEFNGKELSEIINDWMKQNAYNSVFRLSKNTENELRFVDVRIKLFDNNTPIISRDFAQQLIQFLRTNYQIKAKNATQSIGDGRIIISGLIK